MIELLWCMVKFRGMRHRSGGVMNKPKFALLIADDQAHSFDSLKPKLKEHSVETFSARNCEQARRLLEQTQPDLIITQTALPDGTWLDVLFMAERAPAPLNVIVVGSSENTELYLSVLANGAFDFITPPFRIERLELLLKAATEDVRQRRDSLALRTCA
jgi:DNA-binding NtrC family response regulator